MELCGVWGGAEGAAAYQPSGDVDSMGWARTATVPRGWGGAGKGGTVCLRTVERCGHRGLCPSRKVPWKGPRPRGQQEHRA
jgi:hypothetical protein